MAKLIDGARISREIRAELAREVEALGREGIVPGLAVVLVGADPASEVYVRSKTRACEELGMKGRTLHFPETATREELFAAIDELNTDPAVHGILVQLPIPAHLPYKAVLEHIDP